MYSNFLDQLKHQTFTKTVIEETLQNIKVLLKLEKNSANFSDKSLLKNLGHWLGLLTIAKNKPILHVDINVKSLLIEAYLKGTQEMQYIVPFVTKVLESCSKSKVFKPPNPWTMALMNVLAEIHALQDMKLHLKFEIEVLCNKLDITVDSLKPGVVLHEANPNFIKEFQLYNSASFSGQSVAAPVLPGDPMSEAVAAAMGRAKRAESTPLLPTMPNFPSQSFLTGNSASVTEGIATGAGQGSSSAGATPTPQTPHQQQQPPSRTTPHSTPTPSHHMHAAVLAAQAGSSGSATPASSLAHMPPANEKTFTYAEINVSSIRGLEQHISLKNTPMLNEVNKQSQLLELVRMAIEVAVQEVLGVVMDRSIRIAMSSVESLVKKDFALDPDENHLRISAHNMSRNLTASMAMITCKDYLATTIAKSIKQKLQPAFNRSNNPSQEQQIEQISNFLAAENVNVSCVFIQKTCAEKAVQEADKRLATEFEQRKAARSEGRHYCDNAALTYQAERMPDAVRLKVGRVTSQQMQVYDDFGRHIPGFAPAQADTLDTANLLLKTVPGVYNNLEETTNFLVMTERFIIDLEHLSSTFSTVIPESAINGMLHTTQTMLTHIRANREVTHITLLLKKCMEHLLEGSREFPSDPDLNPLVVKFRDIHLLLLKTMADPRVFGQTWATKTITK